MNIQRSEEHGSVDLALARRRGAREAEGGLTNNLLYVLIVTDRFDEAERRAHKFVASSSGDVGLDLKHLHARLCCVAVLRGDAEQVRLHFVQCRDFADTDDVHDAGIDVSLAAHQIAFER